MNSQTYFGKTYSVKIDRPLGTHHPEWCFIYTANYGYIPNEPSPYGEELDVIVLRVFEPSEEFKGKCIAIIRRNNDDDDKLGITPQGKDNTDDQIIPLVEFQERFFTSEIVRQESSEPF